MSGHSKWSQIKRQKGVTDARRGQAFTKAANAITIIARAGGANPDSNFKLRLAIEAAKTLNMPKENIERAISRGAGGGKEGQQLLEVTYEGFGPAGVAVLIEAVTDNKQRTIQDVRSALERAGGRLSGPGSTSHLFQPIGEITIRSENVLDFDQLLLVVIEVGAEDIEVDQHEAIIFCQPADIDRVKEGLASKNLSVVEAKFSRKPNTAVKINDEKEAANVLSLVNKLDDLPDVQRVYVNFDISEEIIERNAEITKL